MGHSRILVLTAAWALLVLVFAACNEAGGEQPRYADAIFGNGTVDPTPVLAKVDGFAITQRMLDLRYEELPKELKARYDGEEGKRLLLHEMVNEVLRVREAQKRKLDLVPENTRVLIAQRRMTLQTALTNDLIKDREPTNEDVRQYFLSHRERYVRLGALNVAHCECETREAAERAFREVKDGKPFPYVVGELSVNEQTKANQGELGWFNKGGVIPYLREATVFIDKVWDFKEGLNPPFEHNGHWHVVLVHGRQGERPQTLEEAFENVKHDMLTDFQLTLLDEWQRTAREQSQIEYFGDYRPGRGLTARELLERAFNVADPQKQLDLYGMVYQDYPDDELADDALFLAANVVLDTWGDTRRATEMLTVLVEKHPDSQYLADARYMIDNMSQPGFVKPQSIEDLRRKH
jgi:hypothetical protein